MFRRTELPAASGLGGLAFDSSGTDQAPAGLSEDNARRCQHGELRRHGIDKVDGGDFFMRKVFVAAGDVDIAFQFVVGLVERLHTPASTAAAPVAEGDRSDETGNPLCRKPCCFNGANIGTEFVAPIVSRTTKRARLFIKRTSKGNPAIAEFETYNDTTRGLFHDILGNAVAYEYRIGKYEVTNSCSLCGSGPHLGIGHVGSWPTSVTRSSLRLFDCTRCRRLEPHKTPCNTPAKEPRHGISPLASVALCDDSRPST